MGEALIVSALIGAAAYRIWRLAALDQITEPARARVISSDRTVAMWVTDWLLCPWCSGAWIVAALTLTWSLVVGFETWMHAAVVGAAASTVTGLLGKVDSADS